MEKNEKLENKQRTVHKKSSKKSDYIIKNSAKILVSLLQEEKTTVSKLSRNVGISFVYIVKIISMLEGLDFVKTEKIKKFRYVYLTDKGRVVAEKINELKRLVDEEIDNNLKIGQKTDNNESK